MSDTHVITATTVVVESHVLFTLPALCQASGAGQDKVAALVVEGLLQPTGQHPEDWRFPGDALPRTRLALRLARDLELHWSAVGVVMDLLAEIARLQSRLRRT